MAGRWFLPEEEGRDARAGDASRVVVLSYELWRDRFGFDPGALGKTLSLGGEGYTIIGVMPPGFRLRYLGMHWMGEDLRGARDVWAPVGSPGLGNGNNLEGLGRIAPGVSREAAQAEASRILLADQGEGEDGGYDGATVEGHRQIDQFRPEEYGGEDGPNQQRQQHSRCFGEFGFLGQLMF